LIASVSTARGMKIKVVRRLFAIPPTWEPPTIGYSGGMSGYGTRMRRGT